MRHIRYRGKYTRKGDRKAWHLLYVFSTREEGMAYCDVLEVGWFGIQ